MVGCHGRAGRRVPAAAGVCEGVGTIPVQHAAQQAVQYLRHGRKSPTLNAMGSADPLQSAQLLMPAVKVAAAGVFGLQDRDIAAGLLGSTAAAVATQDLVRVPTLGSQPTAKATVVANAAPWLPISLLVAVSADSIHICGWDARFGSAAELARFDRAATTVVVDSYRNARRMTLIEQTSGYRLPLTATVSRLNSYGAGARAVLAQLPATPPQLTGYPTSE